MATEGIAASTKRGGEIRKRSLDEMYCNIKSIDHCYTVLILSVAAFLEYYV